MIYDFGPRAQWVYTVLRERITGGEFTAGMRLPSHTELATEFGVAPLTVRQVLSRLEEEGIVSRQQGRGTFVREMTIPAVLIAEDDPEMSALLSAHVQRAGYRPLLASNPIDALELLQNDQNISLVFSDVRMPDRDKGVEFIRTVRRRWPQLPLAAVTGFPQDLSELHGTPESPVLILPKPVWAHQIQEALRLALRTTYDTMNFERPNQQTS
ncbi:MAG: GntR family transcriptional regulator [Chloroflexia bacterium]